MCNETTAVTRWNEFLRTGNQRLLDYRSFDLDLRKELQTARDQGDFIVTEKQDVRSEVVQSA